MSGAGDVRKIGSGNIGATNVLRTGKKWAAAATLLCDGAKGAAAVLLARMLLPPGAEIFAAAGAVLGHMFPLWLGFKGGKGVATYRRRLPGAVLAGRSDDRRHLDHRGLASGASRPCRR